MIRESNIKLNKGLIKDQTENKEPKEIKLDKNKMCFCGHGSRVNSIAFMIKFFGLRSHYLKSVISFWYPY